MTEKKQSISAIREIFAAASETELPALYLEYEEDSRAGVQNLIRKYQKQEEFIRNIVSFATQWDVCCVVVLHPKKMDMYRKMSIFDLQGVSAAVNLTHRVLALYRVRPEEKKGKVQKSKAGWVQEPIPYDVTIEVLKDRFGSGAGKSATRFCVK